MAADVTPLAALAPYSARALWDALVTLMVMALATFWDVLPHLIQLFGFIAVILTVWEKPTVQRFVARRRTRNPQEDNHEIGR